jgi:hypothetical protein
LLADYLDRLFDLYAEEEIKDPPRSEDELIKAALGSIERFRPYRCNLRRSANGFFERLASVRRMHRQVRWSENAETENLGFIAWELYLYALAVLLREPAFSAAAKLLAPMGGSIVFQSRRRACKPRCAPAWISLVAALE